MKGIILAAGSGTRLGPATLGIGHNGRGVSKGLVSTCARPTVYYPLSDLITAGIDDILVIAAPHNVDQYKALLGDGSELGISLSYDVQTRMLGIAEAFIIGEAFIGKSSVALTFCDNVFIGGNFTESLQALPEPNGAHIFARWVPRPQEFGVVLMNKEGKAISLEEKPEVPKSHFAVPGMYFYDHTVVEIAHSIQPSARDELEITDVNRVFMEQTRLSVSVLKGTDWHDTGTEDALIKAACAVQSYELENGVLVGSPEAAAFFAGRIGAPELLKLAERLSKSRYGQRLIELATNGHWPTD